MYISTKLLETGIRTDFRFPLYIYKINCNKSQPTIFCHWHEEFEIIYTKSNGSIELDGTVLNFNENDILFINKETLHMVNTTSKGPLFAIVFDYSFLDFKSNDYCQIEIMQKFKEKKLCFPPLLTRDHPLYETIKTYITELINYYYGDVLGKELKIKSNLYNIIFKLYSNKQLIVSEGEEQNYSYSQLSYVKLAIAYMETNYSSSVTIEALAKHVNLSKHHFIRIFKQITGVTPINYLLYLRTTNSLDYLSKGYSVTETALLSGFSNVSYYIKVFKKMYTLSPKKYQKSTYKHIDSHFTNPSFLSVRQKK